MYPNTNFLKFFPAEELPETKGSVYRSGCLRAGTYFVLRKIIAEYRLDGMRNRITVRRYTYLMIQQIKTVRQVILIS